MERFNRTLKSRLERYFTENKTTTWINVLEDFTRNINNSVNRSIGMEPGKVTDKNAHQIRDRLYGQEDNIHPCKLEKGDKVRIPKIKNIHSKGYAQSKHAFLPDFVSKILLRLVRYNLYDYQLSKKPECLLLYLAKSRWRQTRTNFLFGRAEFCF